jgi:hypothetical protein
VTTTTAQPNEVTFSLTGGVETVLSVKAAGEESFGTPQTMAFGSKVSINE